MTLDLDEIEKRALEQDGDLRFTAPWVKLDVPALVAEVRRLRAFKEQATKQFILEWPKGPPEMVQFPDGHIEFKSEPMRVREMTLDDARALSRREALEEAAKVAEDTECAGISREWAAAQKAIAAAIRALGAK